MLRHTLKKQRLKVSNNESRSKYEVKTPKGVAGIRGSTEYDVSAGNRIAVGKGSLVVVHVVPAGAVMTKVVQDGQVFEPANGNVRDLTPEELKEFNTLTSEKSE